MRRCNYCNKVYLTDFKNCPLCGKHTVSWEPVEDHTVKTTIKETMDKIMSFLINMGE